MLTIDEAVEELENGFEITIETEDNYYSIGPADTFIGGDGQDGYISEVLGNVVYDDAEKVLMESIDFLGPKAQIIITN